MNQKSSVVQILKSVPKVLTSDSLSDTAFSELSGYAHLAGTVIRQQPGFVNDITQASK
jgi:hypothetical protein